MTGPSGRIHPPFDDDDDELMALFRAMPDDEVDALLSGRPTSPGAPPAEQALSELMTVLRADAGVHGAPPMSDELRRQVHRPVRAGAPRGRRFVVGGVVGVVLGASAVGAAAAQNVLPAVVQDVASNAADLVGVDIPRAEERDDDGPVVSTDEPGETNEDGGTPSDGSGNGPSTSGNGDPNGPPTSTPGGATPADPRGEGPATPGSGPDDPGSQGQGNQGQGNQGQGQGNEQVDPGSQGQGNQGQGNQGQGQGNQGQGKPTD